MLAVQIKTQFTKAFYDILRTDLNKTPPNTVLMRKLIVELVEALYKFVPSKKSIHNKIRSEILCDTIDINTMPTIIISLIKWIKMFQAPVYDKKTSDWTNKLKSCENCTEFIIKFLQEYYEHVEICYKELWEARERLINGENVVPLKYRTPSNTKGVDGVPSNMKTGK